MKKTFITPMAEVKAMETTEMICASTLGVSTEQKGGTDASNPIQAGAKSGNMSTLGRMATWAMGKLDF